eukprot:TRINITY_DN20930_c0_g2_i1.p1 TRINITY_DN20930_c0_g2~~TRINITY_DN20930_c0_g2_i1.p1  ORF type:complete len:2109 (+),score=442.36 TRINITY_DN20930_c0_g2_i1:331-6327(+)
MGLRAMQCRELDEARQLLQVSSQLDQEQRGQAGTPTLQVGWQRRQEEREGGPRHQTHRADARPLLRTGLNDRTEQCSCCGDSGRRPEAEARPWKDDRSEEEAAERSARLRGLRPCRRSASQGGNQAAAAGAGSTAGPSIKAGGTAAEEDEAGGEDQAAEGLGQEDHRAGQGRRGGAQCCQAAHCSAAAQAAEGRQRRARHAGAVRHGKVAAGWPYAAVVAAVLLGTVWAAAYQNGHSGQFRCRGRGTEGQYAAASSSKEDTAWQGVTGPGETSDKPHSQGQPRSQRGRGCWHRSSLEKISVARAGRHQRPGNCCCPTGLGGRGDEWWPGLVCWCQEGITNQKGGSGAHLPRLGNGWSRGDGRRFFEGGSEDTQTGLVSPDDDAERSIHGSSRIRSWVLAEGYEDPNGRGKQRLLTRTDVVRGLLPVTKLALNMVSTEAVAALHGAPDKYIIYTDGSWTANRSEAGWAYVVLTYRHAMRGMVSSGFAFVGFQAGAMDTDDDETPCEDNFDAENYAAAMAMAYALHAGDGWYGHDHTKIPVELWIDNTATLAVARGDTASRRRSAVLLGHVSRRCRAARTIKAAHISAHSLHPWNEMADACAKHAAASAWRRDVARVVEASKPQLLAAWDFLEHCEPEVAAQYPVLNEGVLLADVPSQAIPKREVAARYDEVLGTNGQPPKTVSVPLKIVSANVATMNDGAETNKHCPGMRQKGRRHNMQQQAWQAGVMVAGLQETRSKHEAMTAGEHYWTLCSRADGRGQGGCEIWIAKKWQVQGKEHVVPKSSIHVSHCDNRRIVATLRTKAVKLMVASLWAPCSSHTELDRVQWWRHTAEILSNVNAGGDFIIMMDANAQMHTDGGACLGEWQTVEPTPTSNMIEAILQEHELCMPSTLIEAQRPDARPGEDWTWMSAHGTTRRIDYIAVPQRWRENGLQAYVDMQIDLTNANRIDHRATAVEAEATYVTTAGLPKRPGLGCDATKLADPEVLKKIQEEVEAYQPIPWAMEPTSHLAVINQRLRSTLEVHAPRSTRNWPQWMAQDTKNAVDMKAAVYRSMCRSHAGQRKAWCKAILDLWRESMAIADADVDEGGPSQEQAEAAARNGRGGRARDFLNHLRTIWRERAVISLKREHLVGQVKELVKRDKQKHLDEVLQGVERDLTTSRAREAFQAVKRLKPYKPRPLPYIRQEDGTPAKDAAAARQRWMRHWQQRFDATQTTMSQLLAEHYERYAQRAHAAGGGDIRYVPTQEELARGYRMLKPGKKAGEDGIPSDLYKRLPAAMAGLMHPLCTKCVLTETTPLQQQGAAVLELPKNQEVKTVEGYRAINVADAGGKPIFRHLRAGVVDSLKDVASPLTCGALPGRGIETAGQFVHAMVRTARSQGKFMANVFVDLSAAFDEVKREALFDPQAGAFAEVGAEALSRLVASAHETTWISVQGCSKLLRTSRGVKAGDPLADATFAMAVASTLAAARAALRQQGVVSSIRWQPAAGLFGNYDEDELWYQEDIDDVVYVDDIDLITIADNIDDLLANVKIIAGTIAAAFKRAGLRVNFAKGKTEAMVTHPRVVNAESRRKLQEVKTNGLEVPGYDGHRMHVVDKYKHLGMVRERNGTMGPELRRRATAAEVAITSIATLLKAKWLALATKKRLVKMMVESVLLVGAQVWPLLKESEMDIIRSPYLRASRMCLGIRKQDKVSAAMIQTRGFEDVSIAIRRRRITHGAKVLRTAPRLILAAAQADFNSSEDSWVHALQADLRWLWMQEGKDDMPDPAEEPTAWEEAEKLSPGFWKKRVDKLLSEQEVFYHPGLEVVVAPQIEEDTHLCLVCGYEGTKAATSTHMMSKHGLRNWHQQYTRLDGRCRVCNQQFGCAVRLQKHLAGTLKNKKGTGGCLRQLVVRGEVAAPEEQQQVLEYSRELARQRKKMGLSVGYAECYAIRGDDECCPMVQGPVPHWAELGVGAGNRLEAAAVGEPNNAALREEGGEEVTDDEEERRRQQLQEVASIVALWCGG